MALYEHIYLARQDVSAQQVEVQVQDQVQVERRFSAAACTPRRAHGAPREPARLD